MLLPLVLALLAQEQKFETNGTQVLAPVVVADARGRRIAGLKPADFEIFEDGVAQKREGRRSPRRRPIEIRLLGADSARSTIAMLSIFRGVQC